MVAEIENETILNTVKLALGGSLVSYSDQAFDEQLLIHINSTFVILNQLGVGPKAIFVADSTSTWNEFLVGDSVDLNLVKSYMYLRVRLLFDPPNTSFVTDVIQEQIKEYEWRLNVHVDPSIDGTDEDEDTPSGDVTPIPVPTPDVKNVQYVVGATSVRNVGYIATPLTLRIAKTGRYNVSWVGWRSTSSSTMGSKLYINNDPQAAKQNFTNTYGQHVLMENLYLTENDTLTVYAMSGSSSNVMWVANLIVEEIM